LSRNGGLSDLIIIPLYGLSIALANAFRSDPFDILYRSIEDKSGKLHASDTMPDSRRMHNGVLDEINETYPADTSLYGEIQSSNVTKFCVEVEPKRSKHNLVP
jgi:hypothetical protein